MERTDKPSLGISALFTRPESPIRRREQTRPFLTATLGRLVDWVSVCPEIEVAMGIPREAVRLIGSPVEPKLYHYVKKYDVAYLAAQVYRAPSPKELMLRNHV